MSALQDQALVPSEPAASTRRRDLLLVAGIVSRTWLWFVGGLVLITLLPILIGWRPYVVESGSMEPRIHIGDVVLAAPVAQASELVGRVTVFTDPAKPGTLKTHRVIGLNADGTLITKGDANPTPDSTAVAFSDVRGLGRLLVDAAGLPLVWARDGQWLMLLLFLASLLLAALVVSRDQEPSDLDEGHDGGGPADGDVVPFPAAVSSASSTTVAASNPMDPGLQRVAGVEDDAALGAQRSSSVRDHVSRAAATSATVRHPVVVCARGAATTRGAQALSRAGRAVPRVARAALRPLARRLATIAYLGVLVAVLAVPATEASFSASTRNTASSWATGNWNYASSVTSLNPWLYWKLDETTGTVAADTSGNGRTGTYNTNQVAGAGGFTRGIVGALPTETPNVGVTLNGATACLNTTSSTTMSAPTQLTEVVWFKTTTTNGGKLLGFEMPQLGVAVAGSGGTYDRHIYMDGSGKVWFGVYNGGYFTISSPSALNDGAWHMAAASMGSTGMILYIDGVQVASNANTAGESTTGWFRAGCGNLAGWGGSWSGANSPTTSTSPTQNRPFAGSLDEISIWQTVLTPTQIRTMYISR